MKEKIQSLYRHLLRKRIRFFQDGQFYSLADEGNEAVGNCAVVISAKHTTEANQFFAVSGKKALANAVKLFAQQLAGTPKVSFGYCITETNSNGYFVTVSLVEDEACTSLKSSISSPVLLMSEALLMILTKAKARTLTTVDYTRTYIADPNYKLRLAKNKKSRLSRLLMDSDRHLEGDSRLDATQELLQYWVDTIPLSTTLVSMVHTIKPEQHSSLLNVRNLAVGTAVLVFYGAITSGYLWWQESVSQQNFERSRQAVAQVAQLEREKSSLINQLNAYNTPLLEYNYMSLVLKVLSDIGSSPSLERMSADSNGITISGRSDDATILFKQLSEHPNVYDVEFMTPVRKRMNQDLFNIQFRVKKS